MKPIFDENKNFETNNGKFLYLLLKTLLFYLTCNLILLIKLIKILPITNCFFIILFLAYRANYLSVSFFILE